MGRLSSFLTNKATQEGANLLERYAQEAFLQEALKADSKKDLTNDIVKDTGKSYQETADDTYLTEVVKTDRATLSADKNKFVKAALIPRANEHTGIKTIKFMFNPTELNMSRDLTLNFMEGARTVGGLPKISFGYVNPYSMELAGLLFDTYETGKNVITEYIQPIKDAMDFTKFGTVRDFVTGNTNIQGYATRGTMLSVLGDTGEGANLVKIVNAIPGTGLNIDSKDFGTSPINQYDDYADIPLTSKRPPVYYFIWGEENYMMCFIQKINYKLTMFLPNGTPVRAIVDLSLQEVDMRDVSRRYSMPQRMTGN